MLEYILPTIAILLLVVVVYAYLDLRRLGELDREYLNLILDNATIAIFSIDSEGNIKSWNRASERVTGYSKEEITFDKLKILFPDFKIDSRIASQETRIKCKDGSLKTMQYSTDLMRDAGGSPIGVVCVAEDITERKKIEQQLKEYSEQLEKKVEERTRALIRSEKLALVGQVAVALAHEIGNPLTNASLYTQLLLKKARGEGRKKLSIISEQVDAATSTVRKLLDFSRPPEYEFRKVDVNRELSRTLEIMQPQLSKTNVKVIKNLDSVPYVMADHLQLQQVFVNLINNACHAMPDGGSLLVSTRVKNEHAEIEISDTGEGIPKEHLGRIFDPFFTTKKAGKGTGLGLSISHQIIERHSGSIEVKSEVGGGSTFIVRLPICNKEA